MTFIITVQSKSLKNRSLNSLNSVLKAMFFALFFLAPSLGSAVLTKELKERTDQAIAQDSLLPFLNSYLHHIWELPSSDFNRAIVALYSYIDPYLLSEQRTLRKHFDYVYGAFRSKKALDRFWSFNRRVYSI